MFSVVNPLSTNPTKWSNTLKQFVGNLRTNCLSVFDHFLKLALNGLMWLPEFLLPFSILNQIPRNFQFWLFRSFCLTLEPFGPPHHLLSSLHISQPLLPRSVEFSFVRTYFHSIKFSPLISDIPRLT